MITSNFIIKRFIKVFASQQVHSDQNIEKQNKSPEKTKDVEEINESENQFDSLPLNINVNKADSPTNEQRNRRVFASKIQEEIPTTLEETKRMRIASNRIPERLNLDKSEVEEEKEDLDCSNQKIINTNYHMFERKSKISLK